ncbi:MAG: hypothetical protein A2Y38_23420 [Spirochaetes bacterium GWB1_59_5]|nr:MAG: hypothetical protein A2Y38_23420 [Spirochaetes bacterium GWB1_59_5]
MPLFTTYPRYCAACGARNMVSPHSSYGGEVCGSTCWAVLELRKTRAILGQDFDEEGDDWATCLKAGVSPKV